MPKSDNEKRDEVLRRMLKTPHKPHAPLKARAMKRRMKLIKVKKAAG